MKLEHGSYILPCFGQTESGDLVFTQGNDRGLLFGLIDVSGHGEQAAKVAQEIKAWIGDKAPERPLIFLQQLDKLLRGHGSGVGMICNLDTRLALLTYCGVGNPLLWLVDKHQVHSFPSKPGLIGQYLPRLEERQFKVDLDDVIVLASDGVSSSAICVDGFPANKLRTMSAADCALNLVRQQGRFHDDASCLVVRCRHD